MRTLTPNEVNAILIGRDQAYSGIINSTVIAAFNNLYYSEKDRNGNKKSFLEIGLINNVFTWFLKKLFTKVVLAPGENNHLKVRTISWTFI